jgi:hypothetical protein
MARPKQSVATFTQIATLLTGEGPTEDRDLAEQLD